MSNLYVLPTISHEKVTRILQAVIKGGGKGVSAVGQVETRFFWVGFVETSSKGKYTLNQSKLSSSQSSHGG